MGRKQRTTTAAAAAIASFLVCGAASTRAIGAERTWAGTFTTSWNNAANWVLFTPPGALDTATFFRSGGFETPIPSTTVSLDASTTIAGLDIYDPVNAGGYTMQRSNSALLTVNGTSTLRSDAGAAHPLTFNGFRLRTSTLTARDNVELTLQSGANVEATGTATIGNASRVFVGNSTFTAKDLFVEATARLDVNSDGQVTASTMQLYGSGVVNLNSGGTLNLEAGSQHAIISGTLNVNNGSTFNLGPGSQFSVQSNTSRLNMNRDYGVTGNSLLFVAAGGDVVGSSYIDIGNNSTGRMLVTGGGSTFSAQDISDWGRNATGSASVTINEGGTASLQNLRVGEANGTFNGVVDTFGQLSTTGTFIMGGGSTARTVNLSIGANATFTTNGLATFENKADLDITSSSSVVNFNGGATFFPGSRLDWIAGTINYAGRKISVNGGTVVSTAGSHTVPAGATLEVRSAGSYTTFNPLSMGNATLLVDGPNSLLSVQPPAAQTSFWNSGANVTVRNSANANIGSTLAMLPQVNNTSTLTLEAGGVLTANALVTNASGTGFAIINIASSAKLVANSLTLNGNTKVDLVGPAGNFAPDIQVNGPLVMSNEALITLGVNDELRAASLTMANNSRIRLDNTAQVTITATGPAVLGAIRQLILSGYNNETWTGPGLSSLQGVSDSSIGLSYEDTGFDIRVVATFRGDSDIDGDVDFDDLLVLSQNYGFNGRTWVTGDFNYDSTVGFDDLLKLAQNYGGILSTTEGALLKSAGGSGFMADWSLARSLVPEPSSAIATLAMLIFIRRRPGL